MLNEFTNINFDIFCTALILCKLRKAKKACLRQRLQFFDAASSSLWC